MNGKLASWTYWGNSVSNTLKVVSYRQTRQELIVLMNTVMRMTSGGQLQGLQLYIRDWHVAG